MEVGIVELQFPIGGEQLRVRGKEVGVAGGRGGCGGALALPLELAGALVLAGALAGALVLALALRDVIALREGLLEQMPEFTVIALALAVLPPVILIDREPLAIVVHPAFLGMILDVALEQEAVVWATNRR